jgi:hypothetical protein
MVSPGGRRLAKEPTRSGVRCVSCRGPLVLGCDCTCGIIWARRCEAKRPTAHEGGRDKGCTKGERAIEDIWSVGLSEMLREEGDRVEPSGVRAVRREAARIS